MGKIINRVREREARRARKSANEAFDQTLANLMRLRGATHAGEGMTISLIVIVIFTVSAVLLLSWGGW